MNDLMKLQWIVASLTVLGLIGCGQQAASPPPTSDSEMVAEDDHDHDAHRDHSVAGHEHGEGPHGGIIADWGGGKYHVEFIVDHDQKQATAYILGGDEKTPEPIDAQTIELSIVEPAMQVTLQAMPQETDPAGRSSRFVGTHENLAVVQEYAGTLTGVVEQTPYSGDFRE